jgi:dihydropyrimidinase
MTSGFDLVVRGGTLVTSKSLVRADIGIREERIAAVGVDLRGVREMDASGRLVLPGVIDVHTHMAAPAGGVTSSDDFPTGTRAAAAGGVTTIVDFTVASPGKRLIEDVERRIDDVSDALVDVALHAEVVGWQPSREDEIAEAVDAGVSSFKFYMAYGSLGQRSDSGALVDAFRVIARAGGVALVHAEDDPIIDMTLRRLGPTERTSMRGLARSRPAICEGAAMAQAIYLAEKTGVKLHVCHVSSALGAEVLARGRATGAALTAETCPQYLVLTEDVYAQDGGEQFSVMPPLRTAEDRDALWGALRGGGLSCVATDHCPFRREQKQLGGSFEDLPYGLPGVETLLPLLYSEGVGTGRIDLQSVVRLLSEEPARIFGLSDRKGSLDVGADADLVVFDPAVKWTIAAERLHMNTDFSPFEGRTVRGAVSATVSRGSVVYDRGAIVESRGRGRFVSCEPPGRGRSQGRLAGLGEEA